MSDVATMSGVSEIRLRVRYAETDRDGVVYHANYLVWMEMGRVELSGQWVYATGISKSRKYSAHGSGSDCRYHAPARYDDEVTVETSVKRSTSRVIEFEYRMTSLETGVKLATGSTTHVFCNRDLRPLAPAKVLVGVRFDRCRLPENLKEEAFDRTQGQRWAPCSMLETSSVSSRIRYTTTKGSGVMATRVFPPRGQYGRGRERC